jgi:hypothetical protein
MIPTVFGAGISESSLSGISQMDSFPTLAHTVDAGVTPIGSANQRFSLSRSDSEPFLSLSFVARTVHGAKLENSPE